MGGSFKIGRLFGLAVKIYWIFFLLLAFFALLGLLSSSTRESTPQSNPETAPAAGSTRVATGVLEREGITSYMYGTHTIAGVSSGIRYALRSDLTKSLANSRRRSWKFTASASLQALGGTPSLTTRASTSRQSLSSRRLASRTNRDRVRSAA